MATLTWQTHLALGLSPMDTTHQEFVALLADAEAALEGAEDTLLARWQALVDHTIGHFAQEDRWMADTGFAPESCHALQHQSVLAVMTECARRAEVERDFEPLRIAVAELAPWFVQHARSMDAGLAQHMADLGYDPDTRRCAEPALADSAPITGCGGARCG